VPGTSEKPSDGLDLAALPGAIVVAPFDGRVDYAGRFRDRGLVLIIGHGGGYHSVLAGLDRIDAKPGEWVLAGEPVGAMPDTAAAASGTVLTFELRRDGNPVDPFPVLIDSGELTGRDGADDSRVRE
jgi:septal ring factor EnvC (AmiA/AmiB activator)